MGESVSNFGAYASSNPDQIARIGAAFLPALGLGAFAPAVNTAAGVYGIGAADARNKEYADNRAAAEAKVAANKADPTKPAPDVNDIRYTTGGNMPASQSQIAIQTAADTSNMAKGLAQNRQDALRRAQNAPGSTIAQPRPLGMGQRPIFAPRASQGLPTSNSNAGAITQDQLVRLLAMIAQQKGQTR